MEEKKREKEEKGRKEKRVSSAMASTACTCRVSDAD